jgi:hypothetical protein
MRTNIFLAVLILSGMGTQGCAGKEATQAQFAELVRHFELQYKLSLYHTSEGDSAAATQAVGEALAWWDSVQTRFEKAPPASFRRDPAWIGDLQSVRRQLDRGQEEIDRGRLQEAHEALAQVCQILADLRERNGVVALMDLLTRFRKPMERIVLLAEGKTPEQLSDAVLDTMLSVYPELETAWQRVRELPLERVVLGRPSGFAWQRERESETIAALKKALQGRDREAVLQFVPQMKRSFIAIFMNFG